MTNLATHRHLSRPGRMDMQVRVRVWERGGGGERSAAPLVDVRSSTCAVEVGGGPWWDTWRTEVRLPAGYTGSRVEPLRAPPRHGTALLAPSGWCLRAICLCRGWCWRPDTVACSTSSVRSTLLCCTAACNRPPAPMRVYGLPRWAWRHMRGSTPAAHSKP